MGFKCLCTGFVFVNSNAVCVSLMLVATLAFKYIILRELQWLFIMLLFVFFIVHLNYYFVSTKSISSKANNFGWFG